MMDNLTLKEIKKGRIYNEIQILIKCAVDKAGDVQKLGMLLNVSGYTVQNWASGRTLPTYKNLRKLEIFEE